MFGRVRCPRLGSVRFWHALRAEQILDAQVRNQMKMASGLAFAFEK